MRAKNGPPTRDISDYALSFAVGLPCRRGDVRDGIAGRADAVIALGVLQYISEADLPGALKSIRAAAGKLFLFSSHYAGMRQVVPDPLRTITRSRRWWHQRISAAGFKLDERREYFDVFATGRMRNVLEKS